MTGKPDPAPDPDSSSTSLSLLQQIKANEVNAWDKFCKLYGPLVHKWAMSHSVQFTDAMDIAQEVFASVSRSIESFKSDQSGAKFRGWLWHVTRDKINEFYHSEERRRTLDNLDHLESMPDLPPGESDEKSRAQVEASLFRRALEMVEAEFESMTWTAFWRTTVDRQKAKDVASELGMSAAAVYQAKSRVLRRIKREFRGLLD
ncbi:MAG: RNA polymerase sigma-70 factor (ECF subfamily) [Pirellulaceae bacterium]|jgi:RNA polymerase sigma-70 factor (ECF subfamily)